MLFSAVLCNFLSWMLPIAIERWTPLEYILKVGSAIILTLYSVLECNKFTRKNVILANYNIKIVLNLSSIILGPDRPNIKTSIAWQSARSDFGLFGYFGEFWLVVTVVGTLLCFVLPRFRARNATRLLFCLFFRWDTLGISIDRKHKFTTPSCFPGAVLGGDSANSSITHRVSVSNRS